MNTTTNPHTTTTSPGRRPSGDNLLQRLVRLAPVAVLALGLTIAAGSRVIEFEAGDFSGDLRMGPYEYSNGTKAKVQNLNISAPSGRLIAPASTVMDEAKGKRTANFSGGVTVSRNKLTANGPSLEYKETTGIGVLQGGVVVSQKAEKAGDDDVKITAQSAEFDVDANVSISKGNVTLVNGKQSGRADVAYYEEDKQLAVLTDTKQVELIREPKKAGENRLFIIGKESRLLNGQKLLVATGGVTLVNGDTTTTGQSLYYDDAKTLAIVVGTQQKPAVSLKKTGERTSGTALQLNTTNNQVRPLGGGYKIPFEQFKKIGEK
jgi:lipopolysaccharide export system protein LptA